MIGTHLPVQVSLARAPGVAYPIFLCIFFALGLLLPTVVRVSTDPVVVGSGLSLGITYGVTAILGQLFWPARLLWGKVSRDAYAAEHGLEVTATMQQCW